MSSVCSIVTNPWRKKGSQMPDALVMLPEWRNGNVCLVIHFVFHLLKEQPGHWLRGRKMETVQREAFPNTMTVSIVWWPFLDCTKDSQRNLCPQALVLQLTILSVLQILLLHGVCTAAWSSRTFRLGRNQPAWTGILFKSQLVVSWLPCHHGLSDTLWHYKEG